MLKRFLHDEFDLNTKETVGVEFAFLDISDVDPDNPDIKITIQIWDTCKYFNLILIIFFI